MPESDDRVSPDDRLQRALAAIDGEMLPLADADPLFDPDPLLETLNRGLPELSNALGDLMRELEVAPRCAVGATLRAVVDATVPRAPSFVVRLAFAPAIDDVVADTSKLSDVVRQWLTLAQSCAGGGGELELRLEDARDDVVLRLDVLPGTGAFDDAAWERACRGADGSPRTATTPDGRRRTTFTFARSVPVR